jgi:hypothetical protein
MAAVCSELGVVPDFVKIDVEGHERAVLEGFVDAAMKCKAVLIEGGERASVRDWMQDSGFTGPFFVHFKKRLLSRVPQPRAEDVVFIRGSLALQLRDMNFDLAGSEGRERP